MIYYLPLEHLDKRYTKDLDIQLVREFKKQNKTFKKIEGKVLSSKIETGAFLDSDSTTYFKFCQLQEIAKLFKNNKIKEGDVFFVSDLWFPGIESIKYMAYFHGITVKIKGLLHAGSFTETDYVRGIEDWAQWIEKGWFKMFDTIFLGSNFIKSELIEKGRIIDFSKLKVTGLPFNTEDCYKLVKFKNWEDKKDIVIFSGRLDDEKQPWIFDRLAKKFPNVSFIKTMDLNLSKKEYYELLSRSKVVFSSALQENFGYSTLEGATYNCNLVLPNRLAYPEFYGTECLYSSEEEMVDKIKKALKKPQNTVRYTKNHNKNVNKIIKEI